MGVAGESRQRPGLLVAAGRTSDVYEFGAGAVVKVPRPEVPDHWAEIEAALTAAVGELDVPAPSVIDVTIIDGRHAIVFERIDGTSMWMLMLEQPERVPELAGVLAETHRRIFDAGPPPGVLGMVDRTRRKLAGSHQLTTTERAEAVEMLDRLPKGAALLHGDLHPGNVLMTADGPVAIDWFDASIGHPVSDIIRSSILIRPFSGDPVGPPHLPGAEPALLRVLHDAYVEAMSDFLSASSELVNDWEAVKAASRLSEGLLRDEADLIDIWRSRGDSSGPIGRALSSE